MNSSPNPVPKIAPWYELLPFHRVERYAELVRAHRAAALVAARTKDPADVERAELLGEDLDHFTANMQTVTVCYRELADLPPAEPLDPECLRLMGHAAALPLGDVPDVLPFAPRLDVLPAFPELPELPEGGAR